MSKRLNNIDFINKCKLIFGDKLDFSKTNYTNNRTNVIVKCNICNKEFYKSPKSLILGHGCPFCSIKDLRNKQKNNYDKFILKSENKFGDKYSFPNIESEYHTNKDKITIKCNHCGNVFTKSAQDFLSSKDGGCKVCRESKKGTLGKRYSYDDLLKYVVYDNISIIKFDGFKTKSDNIQLFCKTHNKYYDKNVSKFLNHNQLCDECLYEKRKLSKEIVIDRLTHVLHNDIQIFEDTFNGFNEDMHFKCNKCGYEFDRKPSVFIHSKLSDLCPNCSKKKQVELKTKTNEEFINEAIKLYGKDKFDFSETNYEQSSKKVKIKCNECNRYFTIEANSFLQGHGCPYHNCNSSIMEKELSEYIRSLGFKCNTNDRNVLGNGKELDCFIPNKNIAFEFDGLYWHNELNKDKYYHLNKTNDCLSHNIRLIHIFEDEWINKRNIWESMIKNILGICENKIYARKCIIKEVDSKTSNNFLFNNHLQGKCGGSVRLGLYYDNELVSLMLFGKSRHFIGNGKNDWELFRFCSKLNIVVIGGASKLLHYFTTHYDWKNIVSYADKRWSIGNVYENLNFKKYNESQPNYYYVIGNERKYRFNFRKSILVKKYNCSQNISEHDFCLSKKWYRIYDCGCLCYILNKSL